MSDDKKAFVFYRSFYDAIKTIPNKSDKADFYDAIADYALNDKEPELSGYLAGFFSLIKPQIDANKKRYENGKKGAEHGQKGGRPVQTKPQDNPKETAEKPQNNPTETPKEKEKEKDKVKDKDNIIIPPNPPSGDNAAIAAEYRELKSRICRLFNRRETTQWNDKEIRQLKAISKRKGVLDEMTEIETLYNSGWMYRRHDVITFLNNFTVELDRARGNAQTTQRNDTPAWGKDERGRQPSILD